MKKKFLVSILAALVAFSGCGGTAQNADNKEKVIIGGLGPITGKYAIYGISATNGVKLAFEEINANGGILGKQVEFLLEDEKGEATEAKSAYGRLVNQNIDALIGDITSGPSYAVGEDAEADGMVMITPTGTQMNITAGRPHVFRVAFVDPYQGDVLASFVKERFSNAKVGLMKNTSSDYSNGVAEQFLKKAKDLGVNVVKEVSYGEDDKDFKAQLTDLKSVGVDLLMIPDYYEKIALITSQAKEVGLKAQFIGPDGWDGILQQLSGDESTIKSIDGALFASHYAQDDTSDRVKKFVDAYKSKFNEAPTAFSALGYDAAYLIKAAMEKAGTTDKEKVKDALKAIEFDGVTGRLKFDDNNNPIKSVTMIKIQDGKYVFDSKATSTN